MWNEKVKLRYFCEGRLKAAFTGPLEMVTNAFAKTTCVKNEEMKMVVVVVGWVVESLRMRVSSTFAKHKK